MKTHPGVLSNAPSKAQTNDSDFAEDRSSHSANKKPGQQDEKQELAKSPEIGDGTDPPEVEAGSDEAGEAADTTA